MLSHFRLVYFVIWTATLICVALCAPAGENMLDRFLKDFSKCRVLDYVILPSYNSDTEVRDNISPEGNYDFSQPLETCTTAPIKNNTSVPICSEAFEVIRNLSTCRADVEMLKKVLQPTYRVNVEVQVDNVCEDFSTSQSILFQNQESLAFKLADKEICPMVCKAEVSKACSFLLWGYKVQARINDALSSVASPNPDTTLVRSTEPTHRNQKLNTNTGVNVESPADEPQEQQQPVGLPGGENPIQAQIGEHATTKLLTAAVGTPDRSSQLKPQSTTKTSELTKGKSKVPEPLNENSEVPIKVTFGDQESGVKTSVSSAAVAGKSSAVSSSSAPENGEAQPVSDRHTEKSVTSVNPKVPVAASTASAEPHNKDTLANTEGRLQSGKMNKVTEVNKVSDSEDALGKKSKDKDTIQSVSADPARGDAGEPLPNMDQDNAKEEIPLGDEVKDNAKEEISLGDEVKDNAKEEIPHGDEVKDNAKEEIPHGDKVKDNAKNENNNDGDPPPDSENKSKPGVSVDPSEKKSDFVNIAHEKTAAKEVSSEPEESEPKLILDTSGGMDDKPPGDEEDKQDQQFDIGNGDSYNDDDFVHPVSMNDETYQDLSRNADVVSTAENKEPGHQANIEANKATGKAIEKINNAFPGQEDTHFFFYFVTIVIFAIGGYVLFHNKQKIFALIIEGRHERRRRSGASYRKLETK